MKKAELPRRYYGVPELARAYCVSDQTIYNLINDGVIACARFGRRRLVPVSEEPKLAARFKLEGAA
jgi:excisionase family DNA binding protein